MDNFDGNRQDNLSDVLPKRYQKQIEDVFESIDETEEAFFRIFHNMEKQEGYEFADSLLMTIKERTTLYYYLVKYLDPIRQLYVPRDVNESPSEYKQRFASSLPNELQYLPQKEMEILFYNNPELEKNLEEGAPETDWTDFFDEELPLTKEWIKSKNKALTEFRTVLEDLLSHKEREAVSYTDSRIEFPSQLVDSKFIDQDLLDKFEKIPAGSSFEEFLKETSEKPGFREFKKNMSKENYHSFLINSFSFTDKDIPIAFLDLSFLTDRARGKQKEWFSDLFRNFGKSKGIKKPQFAKMMLMNFSRDRFNYEESGKSLEDYLQTLRGNF